MGFYFNRIYNPVYDFIVGQIAPYQRLQEACISKLELNDGDRLLCAGVGTGNEVLRILDHTRQVRITGIDSSSTALRKAQQKVKKQGVSIDIRLMDVHKLDFADGSFDKALCIHVADFLKDSGKAAGELLRVIPQNGLFAITFPSAKEDFSFGMAVIGDAIRHHARTRQYYRIVGVVLATLLGAVVYLPFLFRRERRQYTRGELERLFSTLARQLRIEEFPVYNDFIVYGRK